jgi:hypothetical protein
MSSFQRSGLAAMKSDSRSPDPGPFAQ